MDLITAGELHKQFRDDSNKSWQWPALFKTEAKEVTVCKAALAEGEEDSLAMDSDTNPFNIDEAFKALRQKHAMECQAFVFTYQRQCVEFFTRRADPSLQKRMLEDRLQAWIAKNASVLSQNAKVSLQSQVAQFAELTFRTEQPKVVSRHEKEKAKRAKQREELTKAEAEFRLMDVNKLLAMTMLEQTTVVQGKREQTTCGSAKWCSCLLPETISRARSQVPAHNKQARYKTQAQEAVC